MSLSKIGVEFIYSDEASQDVIDIVKYYETIDKKLIYKFYRELKTADKNILTNPLLYRVRYKEIRRVNLNTFNFSLFYKITPNKIVVVRVLHNHRDPIVWP